MGPGIDPMPLRGRHVLITGASRRAGIGVAIARHLVAAGADVALHHHVEHDASRPWGADPGGIEAVVAAVRAENAGARVVDLPGDLADPEVPAALVAAAQERLGHLDVLVGNHASAGPDGGLHELDAAMLGRHWSVNARATLLLVQAFAARHDGRAGGRIVLMTSGQGLGPMPGELAYAASKGAVAAVVSTLADELAGVGITVNCVNPGPTDTGWASEDDRAALASRFPLRGDWGTPDDAARYVRWLVSDEGAWVTGQVLHSEGGFRRGA